MCAEHYNVRFVEADVPTCCPECGDVQADGRGPRVYQLGQEQPLCRRCGKRLAPHLGALLELASTMERLGRPCRQRLTPPLEVLLDLARAAENYVTSTAASNRGLAATR
jgi:hypothetical protein